MADHVRKQIRDAIETALTGLGKTGSNVFVSRVYPMETAGFPGLIIYTGDEETEIMTMERPRLQHRTVQAVVETYSEFIDTLDDELDEPCKEIEAAIGADITLGGLAKTTDLESTEYDLTAGQRPAGVAKLTFNIVYCVRENAPDVAL